MSIKQFLANAFDQLFPEKEVDIDLNYQHSPAWPLEWYKGMIKTQNRMGVMFTDFGPAERQFIQLAKTAKKPLLDIGCAYGAATRAALLSDRARITACDIDKEHLDYLREAIPEEWHSRLRTTTQRFPNQLSFPADSLSGILMANVINYLKPDEITEGFKKCFDWLAPGGTLWVCAYTPYFNTYQRFDALYDENVKQGKTFPCEFNPHEVSEQAWNQHSPDYMQIFKQEALEHLLKKAGFEINESRYFAYEFVHRWLKNYSDKEFVMVAAKKPS